jgi:hypothetical protein
MTYPGYNKPNGSIVTIKFAMRKIKLHQRKRKKKKKRKKENKKINESRKPKAEKRFAVVGVRESPRNSEYAGL